MEERLRFVARLLEGEAMTELCREFGISRKTGYKLVNRYCAEGPVALCDRSRRPVRYANQRGTAEQHIKEGKNAINRTRLSCHGFRNNELIRIGAKLVRHGRYITFQLAEVTIPRQLFAEILRLIDGLRPWPAPT